MSIARWVNDASGCWILFEEETGHATETDRASMAMVAEADGGVQHAHTEMDIASPMWERWKS